MWINLYSIKNNQKLWFFCIAVFTILCFSIYIVDGDEIAVTGLENSPIDDGISFLGQVDLKGVFAKIEAITIDNFSP